jgi:hypothetical protein
MGQLANQGEAIYQQDILPVLDTAKLKGKIVAIDVDSKDSYRKHGIKSRYAGAQEISAASVLL